MAETPTKNVSSTDILDLSLVSSPSPQVKQHAAGNLTGDLRKVKDTAADMHNLILKWDSHNLQGRNVLTEMANVLIEKVFTTDDEGQSPEKVLPLQLQPLCDSLEKVIESMEHIVDKMTLKVTLAEGLVSLQQFRVTKPISQVLFLTMTLEDFASTVKAIEEDYKREIELKRDIFKNIAHSSDRDSVLFYIACWSHQPYIHVQTPDLLQALIKDTGHIK